MGFVSPAVDYIEQRLSPASICMTPDSRIIETAEGYAIIEPVTRLTSNELLLILSGGHTQFARLQGRALITIDGEAIEGDAREEVEVLGRVTFFINRVLEDDRPTI
ncbi:hypothetical protein K6W81_21980 [Enterobacter sp. MW07]|nr:hypothetical protein [Enterobacter sp. MW07]